MSLEKFRTLRFEEYRRLSLKAYHLTRERVEGVFRKGVWHVVVCDGEVVYESRDVHGIPRSVLEDLMRKHGKPCYSFSKEDMVEEVP